MTCEFFEVNQIVSDRSTVRDFHTDTDDPGEGNAPLVRTVIRTVIIDDIRFFNARKDGRPGTRLTFKSGRGFAVTELYHEVQAMLPSPVRRHTVDASSPVEVTE
jgi:hypothetical protein